MNQIQDQELLMSQLYPELYTHVVPSSGETRGRRRRRKSKGEGSGGARTRKRKLSEEQVKFLEMNFGNQHKLETERKDKLASELGLDPRQVAVWFQNRRARWKNKKLEEEYSKIKSSNEDLIMEKCHLESQVIKLKEQLSDAEKEIQRLSKQLDGMSTSSPSSSFSIEANPYFLGEFISEEFDNHFYAAENSYTHGMDWMNLFGL